MPAMKASQDHLETRLRLIEAAIDMLADGGLGAVTFVDVAARAGLSRGAIHHYFEDREALFGAVIDHIEQVTQRDYEERIRQFSADTHRMLALVDVVWDLFCSRYYRAYDRIRNALGTNDPAQEALAARVRSATDRWVSSLQALHSGQSPKNAALPRLVMSALMGAASMRHTIGSPPSDPDYVQFRAELRRMIARAEGVTSLLPN